jgi:hypothetical protein
VYGPAVERPLDAAPASSPEPFNAVGTKPLTGIPAIRRFFRTNETPIYFVSATGFNLLGIDRWVRNFRFLNYYDSFDGAPERVRAPRAHAANLRVDRGDRELPARS